MGSSELEKVLNPTKLHQFYLKRRESFSKGIQANQHKIIENKLTYAALSTDLCMHTYVELANSLQARMQAAVVEGHQEQTEYERATTTIFAEMESLLGTTSYEENIDETTKLLSDLEVATLSHRFRVEQEISELSSLRRQLLLDSSVIIWVAIYKSLEELFNIDNSQTVLKVVIALAKGVIGSIPGLGELTNIQGVVQEVKNILEERLQNIGAASDILTELDNYIFASHQWCIITQLLLEMNQDGFPSESMQMSELGIEAREEIMSAVTRKVEDRFEHLLNG